MLSEKDYIYLLLVRWKSLLFDKTTIKIYVL